MRSEAEIRRMLRITELSIKRVAVNMPGRPAIHAILINQFQTLSYVLGDVPANFASDQVALDQLEEQAAMEGIR